MVSNWVKSLQCKTRAFDDVRHPTPTPTPKSLISSSSCRKSVQSVIQSTKKAKPGQENGRITAGSLKSVSDLEDPTRILRVAVPNSLFLPSLIELAEAHPSRKVVEIIFKSSWSEKLPEKQLEKATFSGKVEMVFKVLNLTRTVTRFEEYREMIKLRPGPEYESGSGQTGHGRCSADGNEMLRFNCLGPTTDGNMNLVFPGGKAKAVSTYLSSGKAHESGGGGGGRKGMMVCRVIAGRVGNGFENGFGYDSFNGRSGELVVLDPRAVLPCFLIIYSYKV